MTRSNNRFHVIWPLYKRFLVIAFIILFIISIIIISITVPITLTNHNNDNTDQSFIDELPTFNVTYLFSNETTRSINEINLDTVDRIKMTRSFEFSLGLNIENILYIRQIYSSIAIRNNSKSRRKRFVQCNGDASGMTGSVLNFDFNLTYPNTHICRNQTCMNDIFNKVYQQFKTIQSLSIDFNNISKSLTLCSFNVSSSSTIRSTRSITGNFIKPSLSNQDITKNISSTQPSITNVPSDTNVSSSTLIDISFTDTPDVNASSITTVLSVTEMINSNLTLNKTDVPINICLKKLPIIQEQVPPYRITHTSTLFFQDNHILLVVGASKFEIFTDLKTTEQEIIIDGEMVYTNCQRVIEVSLPMIYYSAI